MDTNYHQYLPENFPPDARVWIYQSDRELLSAETDAITHELVQFCSQWKSHGAAVNAVVRIVMSRFIILVADERVVSVSGCSTDSSVKAMQSLEEKYKLRLFDRMQIAFLVEERVISIPLNEIPQALLQGRIRRDTPVFNNSVTSLQHLRERWLLPVHQSWLGSRINKAPETSHSGPHRPDPDRNSQEHAF